MINLGLRIPGLLHAWVKDPSLTINASPNPSPALPFIFPIFYLHLPSLIPFLFPCSSFCFLLFPLFSFLSHPFFTIPFHSLPTAVLSFLFPFSSPSPSTFLFPSPATPPSVSFSFLPLSLCLQFPSTFLKPYHLGTSPFPLSSSLFLILYHRW